jgi:hypothetical protein
VNATGIIAFIEEEQIIRKILEHPKLWEVQEQQPPLVHPGGGFLLPADSSFPYPDATQKTLLDY